MYVYVFFCKMCMFILLNLYCTNVYTCMSCSSEMEDYTSISINANVTIILCFHTRKQKPALLIQCGKVQHMFTYLLYVYHKEAFGAHG